MNETRRLLEMHSDSVENRTIAMSGACFITIVFY